MCHLNPSINLSVFFSDVEINYIAVHWELYGYQQYWYHPCLLNKSELTVENNLQVYQPLLMELFIATKLKGHFVVFLDHITGFLGWQNMAYSVVKISSSASPCQWKVLFIGYSDNRIFKYLIDNETWEIWRKGCSLFSFQMLRFEMLNVDIAHCRFQRE